jgi:hypothetical protein
MMLGSIWLLWPLGTALLLVLEMMLPLGSADLAVGGIAAGLAALPILLSIASEEIHRTETSRLESVLIRIADGRSREPGCLSPTQAGGDLSLPAPLGDLAIHRRAHGS